ncbi:MAG TPA: hypothetical protein VL981_07575 [Candidatus Methylacidiphilales bacterium]|nr:hypothetical protein [Candidatus Methylacidiphilales bacterium]
MKDITFSIISWVICLVIGTVCTKLWTYYRLKFSKEHTKVAYYRLIRLRLKSRGDKPYYRRKHHTSKEILEQVYDETWCLQAALCNQKDKLEPIQFDSSGMVDAIQVLPTLDYGMNTLPSTKEKGKAFIYRHPEPCAQIMAVGTMINGLQTPPNWEYGTIAQCDGQTVILILDATSLPVQICPITNVTSHLVRNGKEISKKSVEGQWFEDHVGSDLFYLKFKNAIQGDDVHFKFEINQDLVPIVKE